MSVVQGTYHLGRVELDSPVSWPDGARVKVFQEDAPIGLTESGYCDNAETRELILSKMDALEPLELTPDEEVEIAAARESIRKASIRAVREQMGLEP